MIEEDERESIEKKIDHLLPSGGRQPRRRWQKNGRGTGGNRREAAAAEAASVDAEADGEFEEEGRAKHAWRLWRMHQPRLQEPNVR